MQEILLRFQHEGLISADPSIPINQKLDQVIELMEQPKFRESYGRLLVLDPKKIEAQGFRVSGDNQSGVDSRIGVESFSLYPAEAATQSPETGFPNKINLPREAITASIVPTEIIIKCTNQLREKLSIQEQFDIREAEKVAMLYFGLATERQVEMTNTAADPEARLQELVRLGREVILSEVYAYFEQQIHYFQRLLKFDTENPEKAVADFNFLQKIGRYTEQLVALKNYGTGFPLATLNQFLDTEIAQLTASWEQLVELHTQRTAAGSPVESQDRPPSETTPATENIDTDTNPPERRSKLSVPQFVRKATKIIFGL